MRAQNYYWGSQIFPSSPSYISGDCLLKLTLHSNLGTTSYFEFCIFQSSERYSSPVVTHPIPNLLFKCSNYLKKKSKTNFERISLVVQWMGVHLPMQGTRVQSLVWEGYTCPGATEPGHHNYEVFALEPKSRNYWACVPQLLKPTCPGACMLQLLKPVLLEPVLHKRRQDSKPVHCNQEQPRLAQLEKARVQQQRPREAGFFFN